MATQIPNLFTTYDLTGDEQLQGMILNETQMQTLQTERANLAEERSRLTIDPNDIYASIQAEAYILGKMDLLGWLIESSVAANAELNDPEYNSEL